MAPGRRAGVAHEADAFHLVGQGDEVEPIFHSSAAAHAGGLPCSHGRLGWVRQRVTWDEVAAEARVDVVDRLHNAVVEGAAVVAVDLVQIRGADSLPVLVKAKVAVRRVELDLREGGPELLLAVRQVAPGRLERT